MNAEERAARDVSRAFLVIKSAEGGRSNLTRSLSPKEFREQRDRLVKGGIKRVTGDVVAAPRPTATVITGHALGRYLHMLVEVLTRRKLTP